jgi:hypothetical protein
MAAGVVDLNESRVFVVQVLCAFFGRNKSRVEKRRVSRVAYLPAAGTSTEEVLACLYRLRFYKKYSLYEYGG